MLHAKRILFSQRKAIAKAFEKWANENYVLICSESVVAFLQAKGLLNEEAALVFLEDGNMDRYEKHIIKCLGAAKQGSTNGVDCKVSLTLIDAAIGLIKEKDDMWISVDDQLPPSGVIVLFAGKNRAGGRMGVQRGAYYMDKGWYSDVTGNLIDRGDVVTHWMQLPEPPEEGNNAQVGT